MTNAMTSYPVANIASLSADHLAAYAAVVYKVANSDGLSPSEAATFEQSIKQLFGERVTMAKVESLVKKSIAEIVHNDQELKVLAPYIIRDAARVADSDGRLSDKELASLKSAGTELGLSATRVESVLAAVTHHRQMAEAWGRALNG